MNRYTKKEMYLDLAHIMDRIWKEMSEEDQTEVDWVLSAEDYLHGLGFDAPDPDKGPRSED